MGMCEEYVCERKIESGVVERTGGYWLIFCISPEGDLDFDQARIPH